MMRVVVWERAAYRWSDCDALGVEGAAWRGAAAWAC